MYPSANTRGKGTCFNLTAAQPASEKQPWRTSCILAESIRKLFRTLEHRRLLKCTLELALERQCPWPLPSFMLLNTQKRGTTRLSASSQRTWCLCEQHERQVSARISRHLKFKVTWSILRQAKGLWSKWRHH